MLLSNQDELGCLSFEAEDFRKLYVEKINNINDPSFEKYAEILYQKCYEDGVNYPFIGNSNIRKVLSENAIRKLYDISADLTAYVWNDIQKTLDWIANTMYDIESIRSFMLIENDKDQEVKLLQNSFHTLIVTLGEPLVQLFLRHPRSLEIRNKAIHLFETELRIVSSFYEKGFLKSFILTGDRASNPEFYIRDEYDENFPNKAENSKGHKEKLSFFKPNKSDASLNDNQLGTVSIKSNDKIEKEVEIHEENEINKNTRPLTFYEVLKEIEEDIEAFKLCNHTSYNNKLIFFLIHLKFIIYLQACETLYFRLLEFKHFIAKCLKCIEKDLSQWARAINY
jgi:hypothetical protein